MGREEGRAGQGRERDNCLPQLYLFVTITITYFTLCEVITFKVTLTRFYFIIHRNKSKIVSGVAMGCSDQHSRFRQNAM